MDELSEGGSSEDLHCVGDPDQISDLTGYTEDFDITFHTLPIIFDKAISHVVAGSALVAQHLLDSGELDVMAVYLVRGTRPHKDGRSACGRLAGGNLKQDHRSFEESQERIGACAAPLQWYFWTLIAQQAEGSHTRFHLACISHGRSPRQLDIQAYAEGICQTV